MDTPLRKELEHRLKEKQLSDSTIKLYLRNLEKLNGGPLKDLKFLKDVEAVDESLKEYKPNTRRGYYISICSVLSGDVGTKPKKALYDKWFEKLIALNKQLKGDEAKNEKSETQKENWMEWKDVEEKREELGRAVQSLKKPLTVSQYETLLSWVLVSFYTLIPPRRNEYNSLQLVKSGATDLPTDKNYVEMDGKRLVLNKFKTAKKEGQVVIDIPEQLMSVIDTYLSFHPLLKGKKVLKSTNVPFFVYHDGEPLNKVNSITRILNKVFHKRIGSSMLRHIYLSGKYGDQLQEMKDDAKMMSHSLSQQKDYIKKEEESKE